MQRLSVFLDINSLYCQDASSFHISLNIISIKTPASYLVVTKKLILKFQWKIKRLRIADMILNDRNNAGKQTLPAVKTIKLQYQGYHCTG